MSEAPHWTIPPLHPSVTAIVGEQPFRVRAPDRCLGDVLADDRTLVFGDSTGLEALDVETGLSLGFRKIDSLWSCEEVRAAHDGASVWMATSSAILRYDVAGARALGSVPSLQARYQRIAPCPTDVTRAVVGSAGAFALVQIDHEARSAPLDLTTPMALAVRWSVDGRSLFARSEGRIAKLNGEDGSFERVVYTSSPGRRILDCVSLDAEELLILDNSGAVKVISAQDGSTLREGSIAHDVIECSDVSKEGKALIITPRGWFVLDTRTLAKVGDDLEIATSWERRPLLLRGKERALVFDSHGAIHRVSLSDGASTVTPPAHFATAISYSDAGDTLDVLRFHSPIERISLDKGRSTFLRCSGPLRAALSRSGRYALVNDERQRRQVITVEDDESVGPTLALSEGRNWALDDEGRPWILTKKAITDGSQIVLALDGVEKARAFVVSPSGRRALVCLASSLIVVDLEGARELARWKESCLAAWFIDDERAVLSAWKRMRWVDVATGEPTVNAKTAGSERIAVSPSGRFAVTIGVGIDDAVLIDRDHPEEPVHFTTCASPQVAAFRDDERQIAIAGIGAGVYLHDVEALVASRPEKKAKKKR